jgi:methylenetetrahydrofolate dehydrogenase (NADP+)/methenyltetrahydrofolate cyclohydrolase
VAGRILDGAACAKAMRDRVKADVAEFRKVTKITPVLKVFLVGNDPASELYVAREKKAALEVGILCEVVRPFGEGDLGGLAYFDSEWEENCTKRLFLEVARCNDDPNVNGILVQMPIDPLDKRRVLSAISPAKDVDGFTVYNTGVLMGGGSGLPPCTPAGIVDLLAYHQIETRGKRVCVLNRSDVVGKPLAVMLCQPGRDATVTVCHDQTPAEDTAFYARQADIVVVAVGKPNFLTPDMVRPGAVVVDVGINRSADGRVVGDAHPGVWEAVGSAGWVSPVPGGVGPCTVAKLLENTFRACQQQHADLRGRLS